MPNSNAIGWFDIYVNDLKRATAFYEQVLGRTLSPLGDPTGETVMMGFATDMGVYGAGGALVQSAHSRPGAGGCMVYFSVADCAVEASRVVSAGGRLVRPKFSIGEFGWVALCEDTEGNLFGLSSPR
ncbi:MAG: VOC family protein [Hydrogenophaga sp.]